MGIDEGSPNFSLLDISISPSYFLFLPALLKFSYQIGIRANEPWPLPVLCFTIEGDLDKQLNTTMPRIDDVQQQLQQAINDLHGQVNNQVDQITGQLAAQRKAQERSHAQLRELIIGLSVQVMQLTNFCRLPV